MAQYTVQAPDGRTLTIEGPDGASHDEVVAQAQKLYSSDLVDMRPRNAGEDHSDEGFLAHATKTLRAMPDAFLSGRVITDPLDSLRDSMSQYIQNPTFHNSLRAIPGVGMAEDALSQPFRTAQSGDTAGAFGDAVGIGAQMLGLRQMGVRPGEPLQPVKMGPVGEPAPLPAGNGMVGKIVRWGANKTLPGKIATTLYDAARQGGDVQIPGKQQVRIYGPGPLGDLATSERPTVLPPSGTMGAGPQSGFGPSPNAVPPPVEVGGAHIPRNPYIHPLPQPGEETQMFRSIQMHPNAPPSGSMGTGVQPGFSPSARTPFHDPIDTNALPPPRPTLAPNVPRDATPTPLMRSDVLPVWNGIRDNPAILPQPLTIPEPTALPSGRQVGGIQNMQTAPAPIPPAPPTVPAGTSANGQIVYGKTFGKQGSALMTGGNPVPSAITNANAEMMRQTRLAAPQPRVPAPDEDMTPLLEQSIKENIRRRK